MLGIIFFIALGYMVYDLDRSIFGPIDNSKKKKKKRRYTSTTPKFDDMAVWDYEHYK